MRTDPCLSQRVILGAIRFYQGWKWTGLIPQTCRFSPSCSDYAAEALRRYGLWRGTGLALGRLFRCRPGLQGGYDPIE